MTTTYPTTPAGVRCLRCKQALPAGDARSLSERRFGLVVLFLGSLSQAMEPYCARCARSLDRGLVVLAVVMGFGAITTLLLAVSQLVDLLS